MGTDTSPEWQRGTTSTLPAPTAPIPVADPAAHLALALANFAQATNNGPVIGRLQLTDTDGKPLPGADVPLTQAGLVLLAGGLNKITRIVVDTLPEHNRCPLPYPPTEPGMTADPRTRH